MPLSALEDTRCDVCLYFVAPHSLRPLDAAMMARIGRLVPVVPIVAKVGGWPLQRPPPHAPLQSPTRKALYCDVRLSLSRASCEARA